MGEELKPCPNPWCNSHKTTDAEIRDMERPIVVPSRASFESRVSCPCCPIDGPWADTEAEAITAWNTRPDSGTVQELVEAARFLMQSKFKSIDRDNMEFEARFTCFQLEKMHAALAKLDAKP